MAGEWERISDILIVLHLVSLNIIPAVIYKSLIFFFPLHHLCDLFDSSKLTSYNPISVLFSLPLSISELLYLAAFQTVASPTTLPIVGN